MSPPTAEGLQDWTMVGQEDTTVPHHVGTVVTAGCLDAAVTRSTAAADISATTEPVSRRFRAACMLSRFLLQPDSC
jgi:hypothetical protein